ncbi:MAG: hypothetical protein A3H97_06380 [Acidobacteria bacterium RIFCSPLOWO2_02_FULL_65_29]|nr:MAG: hypothetical protein A3H97_06380 [Acidobacteria bacterium RIFCSPLOWO2_02_FULL_65_29]
MQDLRLAFRALRATPVVTAVAVLSLALGIGANTAIFSLVASLLLRPLPVAEPERLVTLASGSAFPEAPYSYATFDQIRRHTELFDGALASSLLGRESLTIGGETERVESLFVSGDFFTTLGVPALLGRTLVPADDVAGGGLDGPVAMISYRLWQSRLGGAASVIGTPLTIGRVPVTIVGVTPPEFFGLEVGRAFDIALPVKIQPLIEPATPLDDDLVWLSIMLRLKAGQSLEAATTALRAVQPQIRAAAMPRTFRAAEFLKDPLTLNPAGAGVSALRQRFGQPLVAVFAVVALVVLIACANIANLMLARGAARQHELSVRLALGASPWRLARQSFVESLVLAAIGSIVGLAFAAWAGQALVAQLSTSTTRAFLHLPLDWRVLAFTGATMIATALLFGTAPALCATRSAPMDALKDRRAAGRSFGFSAANSLIVAQVALSLMLVVAAGLFVRTFDRLARAPLGFDRDRTVVVTLAAPTILAGDRNPFYHRLVSAASAVPGVAYAGGSLNPPLIGVLRGDLVVSAPGVTPPPDAERISQSNETTPGWFSAYGTVVRAGRDFDDHDTTAAPPVMLVNEAFVRRYFPDRSLIGTTLAVTFRAAPLGDHLLGSRTVVGVVGDAVYRSIREPVRPAVYFPLAQRDGPLLFDNFYIAVRSSTESPVLLTRSLTAALTSVSRDLTLTFRPLAQQVNDSLVQDRLVAMLSGFFGGLALLLAGLGLYGVTSYSVARRRADIGIRMALGAAPAGVVRLVLTRVAVLVGLGVILGVGTSAWASRFVAPLLYGLEPRDPLTLVGAVLVLSAVGALAGWLPARRASRLDPAAVLREG